MLGIALVPITALYRLRKTRVHACVRVCVYPPAKAHDSARLHVSGAIRACTRARCGIDAASARAPPAR